MKASVLIDEVHVTVRVPPDLPEAELRAVRRVLLGTPFTAGIRRAVRVLVRAFPDLAACRVSVTR